MTDCWSSLNASGFGFFAISCSTSLSHLNGFASCLAKSCDVSIAFIGSPGAIAFGKPSPSGFIEVETGLPGMIGKLNSDIQRESAMQEIIRKCTHGI